jgi:hypothetical protein
MTDHDSVHGQVRPRTAVLTRGFDPIDPVFGEVGLDEHGLYAGETHLLQQLDGGFHVGAIAPRTSPGGVTELQ